MINKALALVRRALSTDARDVRPHLFRLALGAVVLCTLMSIHADRFYRGAPGLDLFKWVCLYNYWFITIAGASFFATAITEEKEERTLSLLKMAGVGPAALLFGKWIPRILGAFLLIAIQIPFTLLAITLGGVLWDQVGAAYVALFAHLFLVGNLGLLASVIMSGTSAACGLVVVLLFLYHVLPSMLVSAIEAAFPSGGLPVGISHVKYGLEKMVEMGGFLRIGEIVSTGFNDPWISFQVQANVVVGGVLLGLAWLLFEPCTRNEVEPGESRWVNRLRHLGLPTGRRRAWDWPLVWKDFHYLGGGFLVALVKLLAYGGLIFLVAVYFRDWDWSGLDRETLGGAAVWIALFILVLESAVLVTRLYRTEMTQQTWSTLTILPLSLFDIAYPKLLGAALALVPSLAYLFFGLTLIPDHFGRFIEELLRHSEAMLGFSYGIMQILLAIHVACWFSVLFRWAVWPLAIFMAGFVVFMMNMLIVSCLTATTPGPSGAEGILFLMCCKAVFLNGLVHFLIGRRLAEMAAE